MIGTDVATISAAYKIQTRLETHEREWREYARGNNVREHTNVICMQSSALLESRYKHSFSIGIGTDRRAPLTHLNKFIREHPFDTLISRFVIELCYDVVSPIVYEIFSFT